MAKHLNRAEPSSTTSNISDQALTPDEPRVSTKSAGTARSALPATADSSDARPIRRLPAYRTWVPALLIWILSCAVHFGIFALSLSRDLQHPMSKVNRNLDYLSYLNIWDALFYERIYKHGYPQELPFLPDGTVNHNTWAFMPLQSVLSGGVSNVFGIDYRLASVLVTLAAGCALSLVLYRLFVGSLNWSARGVFDARPQAGDESRNRLALWALAVYALSPASPIFVTGYAEALSTLFLALCAWCVTATFCCFPWPFARPCPGRWVCRWVPSWVCGGSGARLPTTATAPAASCGYRSRMRGLRSAAASASF